MSDTITIYKIRSREDGLYSCGGMDPSFSKKGKTWNSVGSLKNHLNIVSDTSVYADCDVIEIEVRHTEAVSTPAAQWVAEMQARKAAEKREREERRRQAQEERDRAELARLKAKLGET